VILTLMLRLSVRTFVIFPGSPPGSQLSQETFCRFQQLFDATVWLCAVVRPVEYGDLKADFRTIPAIRGIHNPMHWRLRILTGLEQIQRLKEDTAEMAQIAYQFVEFLIFARREMLGILKSRIQVELKPNLDDPIGSIFDIEGIVVEADLARGNHVTQILFTRECALQNKRNGHSFFPTLGRLSNNRRFAEIRLFLYPELS
jgi:hypothetical protein